MRYLLSVLILAVAYMSVSTPEVEARRKVVKTVVKTVIRG